MTATLARPAAPTPGPAKKSNLWRHFERHAWFFMRISGVALLLLAVGHMLIMLTFDPAGPNPGVHRVDSSFVAARWHQPFWRGWDLIMLWLAQLHGANGVRVVIDDYARRPATRLILRTLLAVSAVITLAAGTYALIAFS
jgi:succinate dehydrogenase / fumarate reductase membrane anchor subunit